MKRKAKRAPAKGAVRFKPLALAHRVPLEREGELPVKELVLCLCAVHLSNWVLSPFQDAGGVMLVGPPGMLKTTILKSLERNYANVLELSDINQKGLTDLKSQLTTGKIKTLVFSEWSKIYERNPYTASNAEGTVKALVAEGFTAAAFEDATIAKLRARAVVIGAMAERFRMQHSRAWDDNGFARRFLWPLVTLKDQQILERAVENVQLVNLGITRYPPVPTPAVIQDTTTQEERRMLTHMVKYQPAPHASQMALLHKMLCVLKWWGNMEHLEPDTAYTSLAYFARALGPNGAELVV